MIAWPSLLPERPRPNGFTAMLRSNADAVSPELGEPMSRARFTGAVDDVGCSLTLDAEKLAVFEAFFRHDLKFGALPFIWSHPITGEAATANFLGRPPSRRSLGGDLYEISMQVLFT